MTESTRIIPGKLSLDPNESALIVSYTSETLADNRGVMIVVDSKQHNSRIKLKTLNSSSNFGRLAGEIIKRCQYLQPSQTSEVEDMLRLLANRQSNTPDNDNSIANSRTSKSSDIDSSTSVSSTSDAKTLSTSANVRFALEKSVDLPPKATIKEEKVRPAVIKSPTSPTQPLTLTMDECPPVAIEAAFNFQGPFNMEQHIELLYDEDDSAKLEVLFKIRHFSCQSSSISNLEYLVQHVTVIGALSRMLSGDEGRDNIALQFEIAKIFLASSNFMEMHRFLHSNRIGMTCMNILDFETRRIDFVMSDIRKLNRQNRLLTIISTILLNLSDDVTVERKMIKKGLMPLLEKLFLSRLSLPYLTSSMIVLIVQLAAFFQKLSIFSSNLDSLKNLLLCSGLNCLLPCRYSKELSNVILACLFNISLDIDIKNMMIGTSDSNSIIPTVIQCMRYPQLRAKAIKLLYSLSWINDADATSFYTCCKIVSIVPDSIAILCGLVINFPVRQSVASIPRDLAALLINLTHSDVICEAILEQNNGQILTQLMSRAISTQDSLVLKIVRNISSWTYRQQDEAEDDAEYKWIGLWHSQVKPLIKKCMDTDNHDFLVECFGIFGNITLIDYPNWLDAISGNNSQNRNEGTLLFHLIPRLLVSGVSQDDVKLEVVHLLSNLLVCTDMARLLAAASTPPSSLIQLIIDHVAFENMQSQNGDDELLHACLCLFTQMMEFAETSAIILPQAEIKRMNDNLIKKTSEIIQHPRAIFVCMSSLSHFNAIIRQQAASCIVKAIDVILFRFQNNNNDDENNSTRIRGDLKEEGMTIPEALINTMRIAWFESYNMVFTEFCDMEDQLGGRFGRGSNTSVESMAMDIIRKHKSHLK